MEIVAGHLVVDTDQRESYLEVDCRGSQPSLVCRLMIRCGHGGVA